MLYTWYVDYESNKILLIILLILVYSDTKYLVLYNGEKSPSETEKATAFGGDVVTEFVYSTKVQLQE